MALFDVATTGWSWGELGAAGPLCEQAEQAEALGFHSFWLPENHFGQRAIPSPLTLLAAIAARTERIKLGCTSYLLPIRNPILAAEEVAVLDQLSAGRLILGVGRGIQPAMFDAFAIDVADKCKLFAENLALMRQAWRGEPLGEDARGKPIRLAPLPMQRPEPPIWVAAFGPLALKQVAGLGMPYLASPIETLGVLEENYQRHAELVLQAEHSPVSEVPVMRGVFVSSDPAQLRAARQGMAKTLPPEIDEGDIDDIVVLGEPDAVSEKLLESRSRLGVTLLIVRAGIPGIAESAQLDSHAKLMELVDSL